jgi:hypothetical protein
MLEVFQAQTANAHALHTARRNLERLTNAALVKCDEAQLAALTKLLCITFSCWAEARFSKLIHTPYGFAEAEIKQIRYDADGRERPIELRWRECIKVALSKVPASRRTNEIQNCKQRLDRIVDEVVITPSKIRNKIAHGQWSVALNSTHTAVNKFTTNDIAGLDLIQIGIWFEVFEHLAHIVENAIESPEKTHRREYWEHIAQIENILAIRSSWSVEAKQKELIKKAERSARKWRPEIAKQTRRAS